jgi:hypothetical protein
VVEYEIYLPMVHDDGSPVDPHAIQRIKDTVVDAFGGYTHFDQRLAGAWRVGGVTFYDQVTILRVLDDGTTAFDMTAFRASIAKALRQKTVLIVARDVRTV